MQLGRVGTIPFFIISGFFLTPKFKSFTVGSFLQYRWQTVILPWLFFISLCVVLQSCQVLFNTGVMPSPGKLFIAAIFHAAYWFIPVSLFSACFLIAFKKYIDKQWFAFVLVCSTLFYCVNLHYYWVAVNHTKSVIGYTLFMWLGMQFHNHLLLADRLLNRTNFVTIVITTLLLFCISCLEAIYLKRKGCADAFASIRFSNILLSTVLVIVFFKSRRVMLVEKLKPQKYVYGVYLIHSLILLAAAPVILSILVKWSVFKNLPVAFVIQIAVFVIVAMFSYMLSVFLKKSRLYRLTGG